jgi:hypothetical protein
MRVNINRAGFSRIIATWFQPCCRAETRACPPPVYYDITTEADLSDAAERLKEFRAAKKSVESVLNSDNNCDSGP